MKFLPNHIKLRGSIMGLVLTIAMLVTLLSAFFIVRSGLDSQTWMMYENKDRLLNNVNSGMEILLSGNVVEQESSQTIDLFGEGNDSVYIERKAWGAFEIVISKAFMGKRSLCKKALLGAKTTDTIPLTLFVADLEKPISVCGNTKLNGKCYIPKAGFKRAYIEGQNYSGDKYVYGQQLPSKRELPELNKALLTLLQEQLRNPVHLNDSLVSPDAIQDTLIQSFDKKTILLQSNTRLYINDLVLEGNIKLVAPEIVIGTGCKLINVLVVAGKLEIKEKFTGNFQAIASQNIVIGKETRLTYPTVLAVLPKITSAAVTDPQIYLGEKTEICGDIICFSDKKMLGDEPYVSLDKESIVYGNLYVNGKLDVKGIVNGSTWCGRFYLKTNSGVYENHLLNAVFDASKLPRHYTGTQLLKQETRREIIEWL